MQVWASAVRAHPQRSGTVKRAQGNTNAQTHAAGGCPAAIPPIRQTSHAAAQAHHGYMWGRRSSAGSALTCQQAAYRSRVSLLGTGWNGLLTWSRPGCAGSTLDASSAEHITGAAGEALHAARGRAVRAAGDGAAPSSSRKLTQHQSLVIVAHHMQPGRATMNRLLP